MEASAERLSWRVDAGGLGRKDTTTLVESAAAVEYWFDVLHSLVTAALPDPLRIEVVVTDRAGAAVEVAVRPDRSVMVGVSPGLIGAGPAAVRMALLEAVLGAVEEAAQRWPYETPPQMWCPTEDPADEDTNPLAATLDGLEPEELLLLGRLDGTAADELSRFHELDDYVLDRTERSGVAEVTDTEGGCSSASWIIRRLPEG